MGGSRRLVAWAAGAAAVVVAWCLMVLPGVLAATDEVEPGQGGPAMEFKITSTAFETGAPIPMKHTGEGVDVSPPLKWTEPPEGTKSFALIADDPDAPMGTWVHWVAYNIPPAARQLPEGVPTVDKLKDGTLQGMNDFGKVGYNGPMPPPGKPHRYFFKLYAVDAAMTLPARASKKDVEKAMKEHILAEVRLMGTYKR